MPRPPLPPTRATRDNMGRAIGAFIFVLSHDARVKAAYAAWRRRQRGSTLDALKLSVAQNQVRDLAVLQQFVRRELHLEHAGLAVLLLGSFGYFLAAEVSGAAAPPLVFTPNAPEVRGRAAKNQGRYIARDVEWFYRLRIKEPPDRLVDIAKEHADREKTAGQWHSVVLTGCARAEQLLAAVEVNGEPVI